MIFVVQTIIKRCSLLALALLIGIQISIQHSVDALPSSSLVVAQVQTGSAASASQEYVSIYNNASSPVDISNWCLVYSSSSDSTQNVQACLTPPAKTALYIASHAYISFATQEFKQANPAAVIDYQISGGLSMSAGHIKLLDQNKLVIDIVGWGPVAHPEGTATTPHSTTKITTRVRTGNVLQDTDNNLADFMLAPLSIPAQSGLYEELLIVDECPNIPGNQESIPIDTLKDDQGNCIERQQLLITELLPNAVGVDETHEFIEFYNPNEQPIQLKNYSIQLGPAYAKTYRLPDMVIEPKTYKSFSDKDLGLTLPNTSSSVRLLSIDGTTIMTTDPYVDAPEGASWALIDQVWQYTDQPTPNMKNVLVSNCSDDCNEVDPPPPVLKLCPAGQERNAQTGRCRKLVAQQTITCKPGQVINAQTDRCKSVLGSVLGNTVCKVDQEKNPATGRCKKVTPQKDTNCPAGQERNRQTNRCRKSNTTSLAKVEDVHAPFIKNSATWWFAGVSGVGSAGYATYEWRQEIISRLSKLRFK